MRLSLEIVWIFLVTSAAHLSQSPLLDPSRPQEFHPSCGPHFLLHFRPEICDETLDQQSHVDK